MPISATELKILSAAPVSLPTLPMGARNSVASVLAGVFALGFV